MKDMLAQRAWAAKRANNSSYQAFLRLRARRGPQKAICAVAASLLTAIYHMLKNGTFHQDLGVAYFDHRSPEAKANRLVRQIERLGYQVNLQPVVGFLGITPLLFTGARCAEPRAWPSHLWIRSGDRRDARLARGPLWDAANLS
jgi:hypothetical protein